MNRSLIHPTAVIDPTAELHESVKVGPFCVVGANVKIGKGSVLTSHVVIQGPTTIGEDNTFYQFSSIGEVPQDKK